jgi:hypothetical protein
MVIFGAGASYDSYVDYPPGTQIHEVDLLHPNHALVTRRPPLAQQLFSARFGDIVNKYPECQGLFPRLRRAGYIEEELERVSEEGRTDPRVAVELAALRFYIRDTILQASTEWREFTFGITNYTELLRTLRSWRAQTEEMVCLTTFNYDLLLEIAWNGVLHARTDTLESLVASPRWKMFKVHGSVAVAWRGEALPVTVAG